MCLWGPQYCCTRLHLSQHSKTSFSLEQHKSSIQVFNILVLSTSLSQNLISSVFTLKLNVKAKRIIVVAIFFFFLSISVPILTDKKMRKRQKVNGFPSSLHQHGVSRLWSREVGDCDHLSKPAGIIQLRQSQSGAAISVCAWCFPQTA